MGSASLNFDTEMTSSMSVDGRGSRCGRRRNQIVYDGRSCIVYYRWNSSSGISEQPSKKALYNSLPDDPAAPSDGDEIGFSYRHRAYPRHIYVDQMVVFTKLFGDLVAETSYAGAILLRSDFPFPPLANAAEPIELASLRGHTSWLSGRGPVGFGSACLTILGHSRAACPRVTDARTLDGSAVPLEPRRIGSIQRVVPDIAVPIERLRTERGLDDRIRGHEPGNHWIVDATLHVDEIEVVQLFVPGVAAMS